PQSLSLRPADPRRAERDRVRSPDRHDPRCRACALWAEPTGAHAKAETGLMPGTAGFIPVLHAATTSRPHEIDTIAAAEALAGALARLASATEVIGLDHDLAGIDALVPRRPLLIFNLVESVGGDCRLA